MNKSTTRQIITNNRKMITVKVEEPHTTVAITEIDSGLSIAICLENEEVEDIASFINKEIFTKGLES